ncbi:hypothetical protein SDC9_161756 [bioreactor metagenome]|uniref:Uncharacterized protein n=1 Tax=bioreactor metagenome TaxID=1076179 RepID=A0A645FM56_9ZZZZ
MELTDGYICSGHRWRSSLLFAAVLEPGFCHESLPASHLTGFGAIAHLYAHPGDVTSNLDPHHHLNGDAQTDSGRSHGHLAAGRDPNALCH